MASFPANSKRGSLSFSVARFWVDKMDKLLPETIEQILTSLPSNDLLSCRLVCKSFKCQVDRTLSMVTHIKINEDVFKETLIPNVLCGPLISCNFECDEFGRGDLFTFLSIRCPKLKVLTASKDHVRLEELLRVSNNLIYFEVDCVTKCGNKMPSELRPLFPRLQAFQVLGRVPRPFCHFDWWEQSKEPTNKFIKASEYCCELLSHRSAARKVLPGISWFVGQCTYNSTLATQLADRSVAQSLKIFELELWNIPFDFFLPNLLYVSLNLNLFSIASEAGRFFNSLKLSSNLKQLSLWLYNGSELEGEEISSLVCALTELESLSLVLPKPLHLSHLPPKLTQLSVHHFELFLEQSNHQRLKFVQIKGAVAFNFPSLVDCRINFDENSTPWEVLDSLTSLLYSMNLKKLVISAHFMDSSLLRSIFHCLVKFKSLEHLEFDVTEHEPFIFELAHHPRLRFFGWYSPGEKNEGDIQLDEEYQSVHYCSHWFTVRPYFGHPVKIRILKSFKVHFKHPLKSKVQKASFVVGPNTWPTFNFPRLLECKIFLDFSNRKVIKKICSSLENSPKLELLTLVLRSPLTSAQISCFFRTLNKLKHLQRMQVICFISEKLPFDLKAEMSKFTSLKRVECQLLLSIE